MARNNDGYTGMLILATVAMSIGVLALIIEATEYGWEQKAAAGAKASIPSLPKQVASVDSNAPATAQQPKPVIAFPVAEAKPETPAAPVAAETKPAVAAQPAVQPAQQPLVEGPIPSPLVIPNRPQMRPGLNLPTSTPTPPGGAKSEPAKQEEPAATTGEPGDPIPSPIKFPRR